MTGETRASRKKGAQPNNKNALRHGLYAQRITLLEDEKLGAVKITEIEGEIAYLRVACARMAEILENTGLESGASEPLGDSALKMLGALDRSMTTLLNYIRQYSLQTGDLADLEEDILAGKDMARTQFNVYRYLEPAQTD